MPLIVECRNLTRVFTIGDQSFFALRSVDLRVQAGELVAITGASGSGKSTLLNLIGGLDTPSGGSVCIEGRDLAAMAEPRRAELRNRHIGFVFQQFNLLARYSALRNVELPLVYAGWRPELRRRRALELLQRLGVAAHADKLPAEMSGGQQQRVAIARALATEPALILADEPTGALDSATGDDVITLLTSLQRERGITVLVVTHDAQVAARCDRQLRCADGRIVDDRRAGSHA
jgi:putative ABC transport system ATP-binding protein